MDKKKEEDLQKIDVQPYMPFYGDITKLNTERTILDLVGKDTLEALCSDIMHLLDTSVAVYEKNGDYAFGLFVSGWCQLMDTASRNLCYTDNNKEALTCGKWLCHENCWNDSAKVALKTGKPTDIDCIGGIKLYAEPIYASNQVIGVINIGYGNPPTDEKILKELSEKFQVPYEELFNHAKSYKPRPPFIIDIAKKRLHNIAFLIGKIVENAQNERKLQESEENFKTITEASADAIFITDQKGNYVYVNQAVSDLLGYSREKITRMNIQDISSPEEVSSNVQDFQCLLQGEKLFKELNLVKKDGSIIPVDLHAILLPNGFVYGSCRDITQRKQIERELYQSENRLQKMLSLVPDMVSIQDLDMNIVYSNWNGFAAVPEEKRVLNTKCYRTYRGLDDICPDCRAKAAFKTKKTFQEDIKLPEGNWVDLRVIPILDQDGSVELFIEWVSNITERKQAEERIKHLNSVLKSIRDVNQLIVQEDDLDKVIRDSCRILLQTRKYLNIEIALLDEPSGKIKPVVQEGIRHLKRWAAEVDNPADAPRCIQEVIQSRKPNIIIQASREYCGSCPYYRADIDVRYKNIFVPMLLKGNLVGIITTTVRAEHEMIPEEIDLLKEVAGDLAFDRDKSLAEKRAEKALNATIETISKISGTRDPYTARHQYKVYQLSVAIARELCLSREKIEAVRIASLIHDIGKMAIPSEILSKPGKLTDIEFDLIKEHPKIGYEILKDIDFPYPIAQIVRQHHERMNGSGYPDQLKDKKILLEAKIIGVADVVEAMSSHRPYRAALGIDVALEEISKNKGILYDQKVADVCLKLFREKGFKFE